MPDAKADANLIAAAPDLLAALEAFVNADYSTWLLKYVDAVDAAKAAVAKARGEKP
jgi:hypothetical protein